MTNMIENYENKLLEHLQNNDFQSFIIGYNLYLLNPSITSNSTFLKCFALLCYLSENDSSSFNKLLQSVSINECRNPYIEFVLLVHDNLLQYNSDGLSILTSTCDPELSGIMEKILINHNNFMQNITLKDIGHIKNSSEVFENFEKDVVDCIYIAKNYAGN
jgi:hypothetical protein